jgi:hypothetical protein
MTQLTPALRLLVVAALSPVTIFGVATAQAADITTYRGACGKLKHDVVVR